MLPLYILSVIIALVLVLLMQLGPIAFILLCIGSFVGLIAIFLLLALITSLFFSKDKPAEKINRFCSFLTYSTMTLIVGLLRIRVKVVGMEKLPEESFLLVGNHRSGFDPIVTGHAFKKRGLTFVAKPEIFNIFIVGPIIRACGFLSIDRDNPRAAISTINSAASLISESSVPVGIYPEGTRNRGEGLLEFHSGSFKIAKKASCPIVVVAAEGTDKIAKNYPLHHTDVTITVCEVIPTDYVQASSTKLLSDRAYDGIIKQIEG